MTATKAKTLLATVRPRSVGGKARRRLAADLIEDVAALDKRIKDVDQRLKEAVEATGTTLTSIKGIGITTAALILGEVGDVRRFPSNDHFATYTGTAPREVSSGDVERHRLSRAGNRRLNYALHIAAMINARTDERGRAYYAKKVAAGKGKKGAMRCLKRRMSDQVYRLLVQDQERRAGWSPGGQEGTTLQSSVADSHPSAGSSEQPHTGLRPDPKPGLPTAS